MSVEKNILAGIIVFIIGLILDANLFLYSYVPIIGGTVIVYYQAIEWLRIKENRIKFKDAYSVKGSVGEQFQRLFDWRMISINLTVFAMFTMFIVHAGSIMMRNTGAYACATAAIKSDEKISTDIGDVKGFGYFISGHAAFGVGFSELNIGVIGTRRSVRIRANVEDFGRNFIARKLSIEK